MCNATEGGCHCVTGKTPLIYLISLFTFTSLLLLTFLTYLASFTSLNSLTLSTLSSQLPHLSHPSHFSNLRMSCQSNSYSPLSVGMSVREETITQGCPHMCIQLFRSLLHRCHLDDPWTCPRASQDQSGTMGTGADSVHTNHNTFIAIINRHSSSSIQEAGYGSVAEAQAALG